MIKAKLGTGGMSDAHKMRAYQPNDRRLVPLDDDIGDLDVSEDMEDVWRDIANGPGVVGVETNGDPHNDEAENVVPVVNGREASRLERGVLETAGLHRRKDLRSDDIVSHVVERRVEDAVGSLGGDLEIGTHISLGGLPETPWYQKCISYLDIRSVATTVRDSESLLSSE